MLLTAVAAVTTIASFAQEEKAIGLHLPTQKGSFMLGSDLVMGELAFGSTSSDYQLQGSYNISLTPKAAYFVKDNLAVGGLLSGNFFGNTFGTFQFGDYHSQALGLGIFARQYFGKAALKDGNMRKARFFVEGGATFNHTWSSIRTNDSTIAHGKFNSATFYAMPGFNYFFTKNVGFEGGLHFSHTAVSDSHVIDNANHVGINLGLQIFMGKR